MTFVLARRGFLGVLSGLIAAPLVARAASLERRKRYGGGFA